jgi:hypothetical protein
VHTGTKISLKESLVFTTQLLRASRIHRPIFEQSPMDQTAFRKAILSDPLAEDAQVLAAATTDKDLREMLDTVRSVESGIEDLLTSVPIPPLLYEKLLTLPEGDEDDGGDAAGKSDKRGKGGKGGKVGKGSKVGKDGKDGKDDGHQAALTSFNLSELVARAGDAAWRFRLAILFTLIIAIAAGLSIFMPGPTL